WTRAASQGRRSPLPRALGHPSGDIGTDLERAFVEYARAATLIVEKIPGHLDYVGTLSEEQRANLTVV
ncbi:hypothetical protein B0H11DRAFT_1635869, partial [Mycena galericulata]